MPAGDDAGERHLVRLSKFETTLELRIAERVRLQRADVAADEIAPQPQAFARRDVGSGNDGQIVVQVPAPYLGFQL